jgi:hypothetical protein
VRRELGLECDQVTGQAGRRVIGFVACDYSFLGQCLTNPINKWLDVCTFSAARPILCSRMMRLFSPCVNAARHLAWYLNYQVNGQTRPRG